MYKIINGILEFQEKDIPDPETVRKLGDHFRKEKESAVRVIILSIFSDMGLLPDVDAQVIIFLIVSDGFKFQSY